MHLQSELPQQAAPPSPFPRTILCFPSLLRSLEDTCSFVKPRGASPASGESHRSDNPPRGSYRHWGLQSGQGHVPASLLACLSVPEGRASSESSGEPWGRALMVGMDTECLPWTDGWESGGSGGAGEPHSADL